MSENAEPSVAVVGAGVIGTSVAHAFALAGLPVTLVDRSPEALERAAGELRRYDRLARLTGTDGEKVSARADVETSTRLDAAADADFVVENVTEDQEEKARLYARFEKELRPDAVIAVNTSAIPIASLAEILGDGSRVVGVHFMNPVSRMEMAEVVRSPHTSRRTLEAITGLLERIGKRSVVVEDSPGFVINRILMVVVNLAARVVDEGVASPEQVDTLFKGCLGHAMGPLRTADLIGIDTVVRTLDVLREHHGEETFEASSRLRRMVEEGHLGMKSGEGFYVYSNKEISR